MTGTDCAVDTPCIDDACDLDGSDGVQMTVGVPERGSYYHGVYPGGITGWEDDLELADVLAYEQAAGRTVAWVYFSHNWFRGHAFPTATATWIHEHGSIPFIRLMLRSELDEVTGPDPTYSLEAILSGHLDADLISWGQAAAALEIPLLVEWGTEMNGDWFSWNGRWNGGANEGPARYRCAYRHIISMIEQGGAHNITWVFHVNDGDSPDEEWNRFENYYPGDDVIDWVGVSVYGALTPTDDWCDAFAEGMNEAIPRLARMAPSKPIFVFELGVTENNDLCSATEWASSALDGILGGDWSQVRGFSWWNETWENDELREHDTDMRVQSIPGMSEVFRSRLVGNDRVVDRPLLGGE